jgi:5-methylthioribose kinase
MRRMAPSPLRVPEGYRALSEADLPTFLATTPLAQVLGGRPADWTVREVGDGNLNLVSIVTGPAGGIAVKQALPYVRLVGESWPLPLDRAHFEHLALLEQARHAADRVPRVLHYDAELALLALELLTPHVILRRGMIQGIRYPLFARHIATFMARTAFYTSDLALVAAEKKALWERFVSNTALCKITEDLIFTEPYIDAVNNRWTSPQLDADVRRIRGDAALKLAICELKEIFLCSAQALIHGDLHTGSIMVTAEDTRVIDPEFAFCGPIGFDVGAVLGNLLLNYFSQPGHASAGDSRREYGAWVLEQARDVWEGFAREFRTLWDKEHSGDAYPSSFFAADPEALRAAQDRYLRRLFQDSLGFAGAKMIRRILGLAHNIDLEWIEDPERRASCERDCLELARHLVVERAAIPDLAAVVSAARTIGERRR